MKWFMIFLYILVQEQQPKTNVDYIIGFIMKSKAMKIANIFIFIFLFVLVLSKPNLFLGAGGFGYGCGSNAPAAQRPYSYVRLGPDTTSLLKKLYLPFNHFGGYSTADRALRAFSHMRLVGAGVIDLGILGILPLPKKKLAIPKDPLSLFYKSTQYAEPGYYKVTTSGNIDVQLTSTQRVGVHRYKFNKDNIHQIYIMPSYLLQKQAPRNSRTSKCGQKCLQAQMYTNGGFGSRFGGYKIYFYIKWFSKNKQKQTFYMFNDTSINENCSQVHGNYSGVILQTDTRQIQIFVGISYSSLKNAKQNLQNQVKIFDFDAVKKESIQIWKKQFSRFQITAINQDYQTKIDTAIYRSMLSPTLFSDFNGQYPSFSLNGSISKKPDDMKGVYTDMSLWDVHRSQFPWILFQDAERFNDIAKSIVLINKEGGYMPKWPFANGHTGCMIGAHANTVLADWILKVAHNDKSVNTTQILNYMLRNANQNTNFDGRPNPKQYLKNKYIVAEQNQHSSCSQTVQLSYNDFGISQVARILGLNEISQDFKNRSKFYKNVWNPKTKFFQPKYKNGSFVKISNLETIDIFSKYYIEGDAWHYRFYAPHDAEGLVELFGGKDHFIQELQKLFERSYYWNSTWLPNPYYWAGNQHDLFSVWLFNCVNRSQLTQKYSRKILEISYGLDGAGLPGNDDYGTMSAWLIFASLGFYPLPSKNIYILGSPVIHSARIYRKDSQGKLVAFNINVQHNSAKNIYVKGVQINGKTIQNFVTYEDLVKQNILLNFQMSQKK